MKLDFQTDSGIGTRANLGIIVLEEDETLEHEFRQILTGSGIALHTNRIPMAAHVRPDTLASMETALPAAAQRLPSAPHYSAIGFGCTSASSVIGSDRVAAAITSVCKGAEVTDPLAAIIAACKALDAKRIGFVTPYIAEVSALMRDKLTNASLEIVSFGSFEEGNDQIVARITPASILSAIKSVAAQAPIDAVVVSCTNLRCLDILRDAETAIGAPVISSNQALAWHMLRLAGIDDKSPAFGKLFET